MNGRELSMVERDAFLYYNYTFKKDLDQVWG